MGCTPICYDNGKRKQDDNNSQNKNSNKNLNNSNEEIYLENPTPIGSKINKEENDKTNLGCDKTSIGASQNHSNNIDKNIIQDLTDNKEPNEKDIKENNFQLCLCNNTGIQKKLFYNDSESLEISSGTMYMNSQVSIFGGNKYSAGGSRSNINNFQGKISKNYYIDGNLQIINEQEERN